MRAASAARTTTASRGRSTSTATTLSPVKERKTSLAAPASRPLSRTPTPQAGGRSRGRTTTTTAPPPILQVSRNSQKNASTTSGPLSTSDAAGGDSSSSSGGARRSTLDTSLPCAKGAASTFPGPSNRSRSSSRVVVSLDEPSCFDSRSGLRSGSTTPQARSRRGSHVLGSTSTGSVLASFEVPEHVDGERGAAAYLQHGDLLAQEVARLERMGEEGERRRAAAEAAHAKILDGTGTASGVAVNERAELWAPVVYAVRFMLKAKEELDYQLSLNKLGRLFLPVIRKRILRARRHLRQRKLLQATHGTPDAVPPVTPELLLGLKVPNNFFGGWARDDLNRFVGLLEPVAFEAGESIMHEGDRDRVMYLLTKGTVDILLRDKRCTGANRKKRNRKTARAVFNINAPCYIGEFAILCREPRSASIVCVDDTVGFTMSHEAFESVYSSLRPELQLSLDRSTRERRTENLAKYDRPTPGKLVSCTAFAEWDSEGLSSLIAQMAPEVREDGAVLYRENERHDRLYFVTDGLVRITAAAASVTPGHQNHHRSAAASSHHHHHHHHHQHDQSDAAGLLLSTTSSTSPATTTTTVEARPLRQFREGTATLRDPDVATNGEMLGEFNAFFGHEMRHETATCVGRCELWSVPFRAITDIGLNFVVRLMSGRQALKLRFASVMPHPSPAAFRTLPLLSSLVPAKVAKSLLEMGVPTVFPGDEPLTVEGEPCDKLIVLCRGSLAIKYRDHHLVGLSEEIELSDAVATSTVPAASPSVGTFHLQPVVAPSSGVSASAAGKGSPMASRASTRPGTSSPSSRLASGPASPSAAASEGRTSKTSASTAAASSAAHATTSHLVVIGWFEFLSQSDKWRCGSRVLNSTCEGMVIKRSTVEDRLPPALLLALQKTSVQEAVMKHASVRDVAGIASGDFLPDATIKALKLSGPGGGADTATKADGAPAAGPFSGDGLVSRQGGRGGARPKSTFGRKSELNAAAAMNSGGGGMALPQLHHPSAGVTASNAPAPTRIPQSRAGRR